MLVLCLVVVVAAGVVLVWRPGSHAGDLDRAPDPGPLVTAVGGLIPGSAVRPADVAGKPCWDGAGRLTVPAGGACATRLPDDRTTLSLCLVEQPQPEAARVVGARFGSQPVGPFPPCGVQADPVDLYDDGSVLQVTCPVAGPPCVLRLV